MRRDLVPLDLGGFSTTLVAKGTIAVAEGATFHHVRTQGRDRDRRAATHVFARVARGGDFRSFTLTESAIFPGATFQPCVTSVSPGQTGLLNFASKPVSFWVLALTSGW